ncbi:hypothetical protein SH584_10185 [Sphingomonas sp. LY29]|uniref:hypothetical protein n=1 Tax=Sphingomonas sp. LY29 TaxID=3095341 RepID=UPI002D79BF48|nr:hypothetical protein [Sphingomonas sp. LY29]WRP25410.1 hypothetical protein SH584_10185 [Sphingomonas sp. LY29]
MGEAVVVPDADRLPWLAPAPVAAPSTSRPAIAAIGITALVGAASLWVVTQQPRGDSTPVVPTASVDLPSTPPPATIVETPPVVEPVEVEEAPVVRKGRVTTQRATRPKARTRRTLKSSDERLAYRDVVALQTVTAPPPSQPVVASLPQPVMRPSIVRPVTNRRAMISRGKTLQLGVYLTPLQAEAAWRSMIRDYTFLVTLPKDISLVRLGPQKQRFYRLQLGTPSAKHAKALCGNLRGIGRNCTVA